MPSTTSPVPATRRPAALSLAVVVTALLATLVWAAPPALAAPTPTTYQGATYPTAGPAPTEDKPQSKIWYNDGAWWALMRVTGGITVHQLMPDHTWRNTGVLVDERIASTGDALWTGSKLYVASRVSGGALRAIRLGYDATTDTYTRESSQQVASSGTESMSIARDSTGKLWVTYTQGSRVYVAHTTTSDTTWAAPFLVPVPDNAVSSDDIATLIAFNGRIGVMWSDQGNDVIRFAVHPDSAAPASGWTMENALAGLNLADDHVNLKTLTQDSQGRVFGVVKTSRGDAGEPTTDPSIVVVQRSADGTWTNAVAARVGDKLTRGQIVLDSTNGRLFVLMATESGGTVYYKTTPLGALSFPTGKGAPFVQWPGASINDPSTPKHPVTAATGLVVLASDDDAHRYYHGELALDGSTTPPPDGQAPTQPTGLQVTATTASSVSLSWTASTDDTGVTGYRVFRGTTQVGTVTTTSYTDSGLAASTAYSYTVRAVDAAGNVSPASTAVTATTQSGTTTPPPAGTGFVGAATAAGTTTSTSVAAPAGAQTGDVLVAVVSTRGAPSIPTPAGWTAVRTDTVTTTMRQAVFVRALTSDTAASTWTLASAQPHVVQVLAFRGVSTTSPVVAAGGAASTSTAITAPSVAAAAGGPVVTFAGIARATTLTPPGGLTERSEIGTPSTARYQVTGETASGTASGATAGPFTTTAAGSAAGIGQIVTLRPAG